MKQASLAQFQKGVTTEAQVEKALGPPQAMGDWCEEWLLMRRANHVGLYRFQIEGTAADGQTWRTEGVVEPYFDHGELGRALDRAQVQSYNQLTGGKAVFGKPGVGRGPYRIVRLILEEVR